MAYHPGDVAPDSVTGRTSVKGVLVAVAIVGVLVNALALIASRLWVCPDSSYYMALAGGITDHLDFTNELYLIRPPGYPLMLAAIFGLFGQYSPTAILFVQHGMVIGIALATTLIAWHLTYRRSISLLAGLMCACSLQLLAFANVIITEIPYTLALILSVYFLVKYHRLGELRSLALASLMAGVSSLIRPTGLSVVVLCVLAALHRAWKSRNDHTLIAPANATCTPGRPLPYVASQVRWRRAVVGVTLAVAPAMAVALPATMLNRLAHGADLSGRCADLALYHRIFAMDRLDSTNSEALTDIHAVVNEAIEHGHLAPDADYRQWGVVWTAYQVVRNVPLAGSSAIMGQAARDLIRENPGLYLNRTVRCAFWMVMVPDSFYRFHPGGAPGTVTAAGESRRNGEAEILDVATYEPMLRRWTDPYRHYLSFDSEPRAATPLWSGIARWFHRHIEKGPPLFGLGDSPYEEFSLLCLVGMVVSLVTRARVTWLLITGVIFLQIFASAALGGPTPRYAVPVKPLMLLYAALLIVGLIRLLAGTLRLRRAAIASVRTSKTRAILRS